MSILKIARMGHPVLRKRARELSAAEIRRPSTQKLIDDMIETMREYRGVGLAAPQVHEGVRIFVAALDEPAEDERHEADLHPVVLINPEIAPVGSALVEDWEGCLSIPDLRGIVPRPREISVRALDRNAKKVEFGAKEFTARVAQHELDHLDGILFIDRMKSFETLTFLEEYSRYWMSRD
jgi:peptide deformylase